MLKLTEGKEYKFLVEKELTLPDNSHHFVLKGPDSNKYLVPSSRYSHYGILPDMVIKCRIDRINCKGEVFLEPKNPWYSEGKSYYFIFDGIEERTDKAGISQKVIVVTDKSGNKISVPNNNSSEFPAKGTKIKLRVERITKGKVYLVSTYREVSNISLIAGTNYEFVVERIDKGLDEEDYFVVKDPSGNLHTLAEKYYKHYGYSVGTRFRGKIVKYRKNGGKTIEPENPFYNIGSVIRMKVTNIFKNPVKALFTIDLIDNFGFTHCIEVNAPPKSKTVRCKVAMIKKGKPLLELL
jgi:hypothetical protein